MRRKNKNPMDKYAIADPWQIRLRETLARVFVCSWRGHVRSPGFDGGAKPCDRCDR